MRGRNLAEVLRLFNKLYLVTNGATGFGVVPQLHGKLLTTIPVGGRLA